MLLHGIVFNVRAWSQAWEAQIIIIIIKSFTFLSLKNLNRAERSLTLNWEPKCKAVRDNCRTGMCMFTLVCANLKDLYLSENLFIKMIFCVYSFLVTWILMPCLQMSTSWWCYWFLSCFLKKKHRWDRSMWFIFLTLITDVNCLCGRWFLQYVYKDLWKMFFIFYKYVCKQNWVLKDSVLIWLLLH